MRAISRITYLHPWRILATALVLTVLGGYGALGIFDRVEPFDIADPDSEVVHAAAAAEEATGRSAEPEVILLIASTGESFARAGGEQAATRLGRVPGIAAVVTPDSDRRLVSRAGDQYLVLAYLEPGVNRVGAGEAVVDAFASDSRILVGGTAVAAFQVGARSEHDTRRIELYAAPVLLLLLLLIFRTVIAAMMPLIVAGISILATLGALRVLTDLTAIDLFSLQTVTGLGTGLAINYSLFILARYREEISQGAGHRDAHEATVRKAGRTVAFSSVTVAVAVASLLVFPQQFLHSTGIAGGLVALFAGLVAILVLPATLALVGPSINTFSIRGDPLQAGASEAAGFWRGVPTAVCRWPVAALVAGLAVMLVLVLQAGDTQLSTPDARELPVQDSSRQVAGAVAAEFPEIPATRLFAVIPTHGGDRSEIEDDLGGVWGLEGVSRPVDLDGGSTLVAIDGDMDPFSQEGQDFVAAVRSGLPAGSLVGGRAAEQADQRSSISDRAPLALALIVVSNLLLVALMTRAIVLPLLAVAVNLLTVVAALGTLTTVFTSEALTALLGTEVQTGIDISVPVISFAIAFGLSTDYGIFLFARIRERRAAAASESEAIIAGVATTGRLISASAALMTIAVGAFVLSDLVIVKEFAVAIAIAVILDATIIRGLVIPASLRLLGSVAWWNPRSGGARSQQPPA